VSRHVPTWVRWTGPALAALALLPLVAGPALLAERRPAWSRAALPAALRHRIHFASAQVPAFPHEDKRLEKPEGWPAEMTIGGVRCVRRIHAWDDDDAVALATLEDAEPEHRLMLFYDHAGSDWNAANAGWGPRYSWNQHGKLMERLWYEPDSARLVTHDYTYYRSGQLLGYSWRSERRKQPHAAPRAYEFLSEFFDKDGRLIALGYEKMGARSRDSLYAWMGAAVPYDAFRMKTHVLYSKAHPGDR
jgi:hypothetical protein